MEELRILEADKKQDVQIAVMAKEMQHLSEKISTLAGTFSDRFNSLTDVVRRFIDISENKVDRETYLADQKKTDDEIISMRLRLNALEDFQKGIEYGTQSREKEQRKIWGFSTGSISFVIQLLTLITLTAAVLKLFT